MITAQDIKRTTLYINGQDVSTFGVLLESFSIGGTAITNGIYQGRNTSTFRLLSSTFGRRAINLTLHYRAKTRREITLTKSRIDSLMWGKLELHLPDGFYYSSVLTSAGELSIDGEDDNEVIGSAAYAFEGIQHDPLEVVEGNTLRCLSTMPYTACRLSCTASEAYTALQVGPVTITNVAQGDVLVVDGIEGTITQNGEPCSGNMSFLRLPYLVPGVNTLTCPETLTVEYYPTYI